MAALLVAMAVMAVLMSAALPVWRHEAQREKEEELVFRGQQYIRALRLYQARTPGAMPTSVDMLVNGHFLRKKYKDPMTGEDFELIGAGAVPGQATPGRGAGPGQTGAPGSGVGSTVGGGTTTPQQSSSFGGSGTVMGGIMGVRSKSKEESIRLYQGRNHYNEWTFLWVNTQPGGPGGRGLPGGPGGRGVPGRGGSPNNPQRGRGIDNNGFPMPFGGGGGGFPPGGRGAGPGRGPGGIGFPGQPGVPGNPGVPTVPGRGGRGGGL